MEQDGDSPPTFWFQPPIQTGRRPPPSPLFNPVVLIILLPILFLLIIFFLLPPFLTQTAHIIKPTSVKKSWDSLNIFLVLFAVLCGVFAGRNDDVPPPSTVGVNDQVNHSYNHNRQIYSSIPVREPVTGGGRLRRNSSSYPDLRQESSWETGENRFRLLDDFDVNLYSSAAQSSEYSHQRPRRSEVERDNIVYHSPASKRRSEVVEKGKGLHRSQSAVSDYFYDVPRRREVERDNDVYRSPPSLRRSEAEIGNVFHRSQSAVNIHNVFQRSEVERENDAYQSPPSLRRSELERDYSEVKEIPVDTFQVHRCPTSPLPPSSSAPEPPPLPPVAKFKPRYSYHSVRRTEKVRIKNESEAEYEEPRPPPPAPPPPPPPPPIIYRSETKLKKLDRQISDATKEIATAFTSLYNQRKRKKKIRIRNIHDNATLSPQSSHSSPEQIAPLPLPPPPPPLPPPPSVFQNMFKKGTKHKRIHSVAAVAPPPPSPPPLPPSSFFNNLFKGGGKSKRFSSSAAPPPPQPPPPSLNPNIFKSGSKSKRNSSSTSPPPPPPLPPPLLKAVSVCTISDDPIVSTQSSRRKSRGPPQSPLLLPTPPNFELQRRPSSKCKPPLPSKASNYYEREEYITNSGSQSPLFPIPPPPPPPPFKMSELKFKIRGDFVSLRSAQSSVCNSPDRENIDFTGMQESLEEFDGGDVVGPVVFPPSPDVNVKADSFISRLKDEWRMEKVNSVKSRQKMGHGILGLDQGLSSK